MTPDTPPDPKRRREGGRVRRTTGGHLPQLPWTRVTSPYAPLEVLSADQVESIHHTSLRILEELGIDSCRLEAGQRYAPPAPTSTRPAARCVSTEGSWSAAWRRRPVH